jgi:hypothetical protein
MRMGSRSTSSPNPRTVEPANAAASGVNLPELQVRLTGGEAVPPPARIGRAGIRTHGTIALLLGTADYKGSRRAIAGELARAITRRGYYGSSAEQLTPVLRDPPSLAALLFVIARALTSPRQATQVARSAVARYSITPETIERVAAAVGPI